MNVADVEASAVKPLATHDLDQAREIVTKIYIPHDLTTKHGLPLNFKLSHLTSDRLTVGHCIYGADADLWVPPMLDCYHVNLTLSGKTMVSQTGVEAHTEGRRSGVIFGPDAPFTVRWSPEAIQFALKIPRQSIEMHVSRLVNAPVERPIAFDLGFDLSGERGQALLRSVRFMRRELARPGGLNSMPLAREHLESMILTQLALTIPNGFTERLTNPERAATKRVVNAAIELVQAHPERNPTIVELAHAVGVTPRSLQRGFREEVGQTPAAYLRSVRLDRVRDEILTSGGHVTVSDIAMKWGFFHLGRFAQQYRHRFGVLPSETARMARGET